MCNYIVVRYVIGDVGDEVLDVAAEILRSCGLLSVERIGNGLVVRYGGFYADYYRVHRDVVASSTLLADLLRDAIFVAASVVALRSMGFDARATLSFDGEDYRFLVMASGGEGGIVSMEVRGGIANIETSNFGTRCVPLTRQLIDRMSQLGAQAEIVQEVLKDEALGIEQEVNVFEREYEYL